MVPSFGALQYLALNRLDEGRTQKDTSHMLGLFQNMRTIDPTAN